MRGNVPVTGALLWFSAGSTALITRSIVAHSCTVQLALHRQPASPLTPARLFTNCSRSTDSEILCEPHSCPCSKIVHRLSHASRQYATVEHFIHSCRPRGPSKHPLSMTPCPSMSSQCFWRPFETHRVPYCMKCHM